MRPEVEKVPLIFHDGAASDNVVLDVGNALDMSAGKWSAALLALALMENPASVAADFIERDLKVAFLGDQGLNPDSKAVLRLIKEENADMVLQLGDFDYISPSPATCRSR